MEIAIAIDPDLVTKPRALEALRGIGYTITDEAIDETVEDAVAISWP